ncbi:MAG TPA: N-acyl homoserine lactonase family protein [Hyphomicrobiaceae bacterium]|jgi:glyoxylase-like metal-dependent hydrolase (beta-lactamase superfamily II)
MTSPIGSDRYEILALKYAEYTQRKRFESFIAADDHDQPHPIDYFVWVIRNGQRTIVVDTGFDAVEGAKRGRRVMRAPAAALEQIGIAAGGIEQVVVTHLHYDHAGTLSAFPRARFHLQAAEMAYATGPCMCHAFLRHPFTVDHVCEMVKNVYSGRVIFHDGDAEIAPGVTVHKVGGHSRGLQCLCVATANGPVVLASDASHFYENFEKGLVFPITVDIADVLAGYQKIVALAGGSPRRVVPGHDPLVLQRYPALNGETQGIVHRLDVARTD